MKVIEVKTAKEFASTFLCDPVLQMAVNSVLNNAPGFELIRCKDCIWRSEFDANEIAMCFDHEQYVTESDYCSNGERKDNDCS